MEFQMSKTEIQYTDNLYISAVLIKWHFVVGHTEFIVWATFCCEIYVPARGFKS